MGPLLSGIPAAYRGRIARVLFGRALRKCPRAALGSVTEAITEQLLTNLMESGAPELQVFANFITAFDPKLLSLRQWNAIAEKAAEKFSMLAFKPFSDGAGHWTIIVDERLVATISQLDDSPAAFAATLCVAAGLSGVGRDYLDALGNTELPRREATLQVSTRSQFISMIGAKYAPEPGALVSVTRAADEAQRIPPPMHAIIDDDLDLGPLERLGGTTGATFLLTRALYETARHLLLGKVSENALIRRLRPVVVPFYG
jgi:hypothetical protein